MTTPEMNALYREINELKVQIASLHRTGEQHNQQLMQLMGDVREALVRMNNPSPNTCTQQKQMEQLHENDENLFGRVNQLERNFARLMGAIAVISTLGLGWIGQKIFELFQRGGR